ncbi:MAG: HD domain-containing protein [Bacteroides sp.]|nr:HD domain-containing protein [Bacteroides sp.]
MTQTLDSLIAKFYPSDPEARRILLTHSRRVADMALAISRRHPELHADEKFLEEAAMLHDIGITACDAPGIHCFGTLPYIAHGVEGARMLAEEGMLRHARVCERHTGSGLTAEEIEENALPLPPRDMLPVSIEEKIICYADKFYSKDPGRLTERKTYEEARRSLGRHGEAPLRRFDALHDMLK